MGEFESVDGDAGLDSSIAAPSVGNVSSLSQTRNHGEATKNPCWSVEEDKQLVRSIEAHGGARNIRNWGEIPTPMSGRTGKQCRERWEALGRLKIARVLAARALRKVVDGTRLDDPRHDVSATGI